MGTKICPVQRLTIYLESDDVVIPRTLQALGHVGQIHACIADIRSASMEGVDMLPDLCGDISMQIYALCSRLKLQ